MQKKWYQYWQSWLTILLLLFVPTFLIGVIVMWAAAPWSKKTKWWVSGIGIGIPLIGIIVTFFLATASPKKQINAAKDAAIKAEIQNISQQANRYCVTVGKCPLSIAELQQQGYINKTATIDPSIGYVQLNEGNDCTISAILSTKQIYSMKCYPTNSL